MGSAELDCIMVWGYGVDIMEEPDEVNIGQVRSNKGYINWGGFSYNIYGLNMCFTKVFKNVNLPTSLVLKIIGLSSGVGNCSSTAGKEIKNFNF